MKILYFCTTFHQNLLERALEIYKRLAKVNPQAYEPDLAMTLNNLAALYKGIQRYTESEAMYLEALEIYRRLAKGNPQAYEPDVARTLLLVGATRAINGQYLEAIPFVEEALALYRQLADDHPENPEFEEHYKTTLEVLKILLDD